MRREPSLDAFKGFCLALVIFIHIQGGCGGTWLEAWANSFKLVGFFVVSGYLLSLRAKFFTDCFGEAVARKWKGLMIPYFVFSFLAWVRVLWRAKTLSEATAYSNVVISQTVLLRGYSTLWFLPVLFVAEVFFLGGLSLEGWLRRRFGGLALATFPLLAIAAICLSISLSPVARPFILVPPNQQLVGNAILMWLRALPAFVCVVAGYCVYGKLLAVCRRHLAILAGVAAMLVLAGFVTGRLLGGIDWNSNAYGGNLCLFLFSGIASSFGLMLVFNLASRFTPMPLLRFIGVNSLVLMATHLPLPVIKIAKSVSACFCEQVSCFGAFLSCHFMIEGLWLFTIVLVLEFPIVVFFKYTLFKVLRGMKPENQIAEGEIPAR
jgi:hypothetical protein